MVRRRRTPFPVTGLVRGALGAAERSRVKQFARAPRTSSLTALTPVVPAALAADAALGGSAHRAGGGWNGARARRRVRAEAKAGPAMVGGGARAERRAPGFGCELREDEPKRKEVRSPTSVTSERRPQGARPAPRSAYPAL